MEEPLKGTVTSLSSLFPAEEAQKASKRVKETITERQKELNQVRDFIADNSSLIKLVKKLPEELHHDIMVPFGKAAFFPGRLIHTNEFLVLLGEGYYAGRTSKQTTDILRRRGKALESQVESLKAVMQDLEAEASFFEATAAEAAEGLVEIVEYDGESSSEVSKAGLEKPDPPSFSKADSMQDAEDEDYARMMSKMDEYEREEILDESVNECDEDEECDLQSMVDELEIKEPAAESASACDEDLHTKADFGPDRSQHSVDCKEESPELSNSRKQLKDEHTSAKGLPSKLTFQQDSCNQLEGLKVQSVSEDKSPNDQRFELNKSSSAKKALVLPEVKENVLVEPQSENKAFTGSIIERTQNLEINSMEQKAGVSKSSTAQTSKPVSRFKMQRR